MLRWNFEIFVAADNSKKKPDCGAAEFLRIDEWLCAQILYAGL